MTPCECSNAHRSVVMCRCCPKRRASCSAAASRATTTASASAPRSGGPPDARPNQCLPAGRCGWSGGTGVARRDRGAGTRAGAESTFSTMKTLGMMFTVLIEG